MVLLVLGVVIGAVVGIGLPALVVWAADRAQDRAMAQRWSRVP